MTKQRAGAEMVVGWREVGGFRMGLRIQQTGLAGVGGRGAGAEMAMKAGPRRLLEQLSEWQRHLPKW